MWLVISFFTIAAGVVIVMALPRPKPLGSRELATYLRAFVDGTDGPYDWHAFEHARVEPALRRLHRDALEAGPPSADLNKLRLLLAEADTLIGSR